MQILHSIIRFLRRPGVASSTVSMHRLYSASRPLLSFMASAPPHWSPPALARRVFPLLVTPIPADRRVSGFFHASRNMASATGLKGDESGKADRPLLISSTNDHSAIRQGMTNDETRGTLEVINVITGKHDALGKIVDISACEEDGRSATKDLNMTLEDSEDEDYELPPHPSDDVMYMYILPKSKHRDGSIYRGSHIWKRHYHVADRSETMLEAMMFSDPTGCNIRNGICWTHRPTVMLQIFSLKLARLYVDVGSVELYGYVAVRDALDPLLNYVVNISRDDPIIVEQGSLIKMSGPKRGIELLGTVLIEYDMRIKTGEQVKDDQQLIDGTSTISDIGDLWNCAFTNRLFGDCGAVDLTIGRVEGAVEATVEVFISEVQSDFSLCLDCLIDGYDEEIRLFDGAIGQSGGLKRSVVAAVKGSNMGLKFKVGAKSSSSAEHCCSFDPDAHGFATREIKTDFGLISVKVTWSTLLPGY